MIVTLYFPEDVSEDKEELNKLKGLLSQALGIPYDHIGHIWGTSRILEFEQPLDLDEEIVRGKLQGLKSQFPTMRALFHDKTAITM